MSTVALLAAAVLLCSNTAFGYNQPQRYVEIQSFGTEVMLKCRDNVSSTNQFQHWVLPDLEIIDSSYMNGSKPRFYLADDNLIISRTMYEDLGRYLCVQRNPTRYSEISLQLPPLWDTYRMNVIIGCSAAACVFIFFTVTCLVYNMRYADEEHNKPEAEIGFANAGYVDSQYKSSPGLSRYNDIDKPPITDETNTKM